MMQIRDLFAIAKFLLTELQPDSGPK